MGGYCLAWAMRSRLEPMKAVARIVKAHLPGILAWRRLRISNGVNNKVKVVAHRAWLPQAGDLHHRDLPLLRGPAATVKLSGEEPIFSSSNA